MNVLRHGADWDVGGPLVLHSPWWIRGHWGRAFDIVELRPSGFGSRTDRSRSHGVVVLRRKPVRVSVDDLKALEDDPREIAALQHNIEQLQRESLAFRARRPQSLRQAARSPLPNGASPRCTSRRSAGG